MSAPGQKFYGPKKVMTITKLDWKTPGGVDMLRVLFDDGQEETLSQKSLDTFLKDETTDFNKLAELKYGVISKEFIDVMLEYNLTFSEIKGVFEFSKQKIFQSFDRAANFLWFKSDKDWVPGSSSTDYFDLSTADNILKNIKSDESGKKENKPK